MQVFDVRYEERRTGRLRVVAETAEAAEAQARESFGLRGRKARITGASVAGTTPGPGSGEAALNHLLGQPFMELDRSEAPDGLDKATVEAWVALAMTNLPEELDGYAHRTWHTVTATLSPAGLRVYGTRSAPRLFIANSPAIGFLRDSFAETPWAGGQWGPALRDLVGAQLANLTYSGIRARSVGLPVHLAEHGVALGGIPCVQ